MTTRKHEDESEQDQQSQEVQVAQQDATNFTMPVNDKGLGFDQEFAVMQVAALAGTDIDLLADMLSQHPELRAQMLHAASANFGNNGIQRALNILEAQARAESENAFTEGIMARSDEAAPPVFETAVQVAEPAQAEQIEAVQHIDSDQPEMLAASLEVAPEARAEIIVEATHQLGAEPVAEAIKLQGEEAQAHPQEAGHAAEEIQAPVVEDVTEGKDAAKEETWETRAREWNDRHDKLVDQFIETVGTQVCGPDGRVDPALVVAWQKENGVDVDGRVGPATLAKALEGGSKTPAASLLPAFCANDESATDPNCAA